MARRKLTRNVIDAYQPPLKNGQPQETVLWDASLPGFGLKVTKAGTKTFIIQYRFGGKTKRLTISTPTLMTLDKAREDARRKLAQVRDGIDPARVRQERISEATVGEIIDEWHKGYFDKFLAEAPSRKNAECEIGQLRRWLGDRQVGEVSRRLLVDWHAGTEQKVRPYSANRLIKRLSWIWEWCEINEALPKSARTSTALFNKFPFYTERRRARAFTKSEYIAFGNAIRIHGERGDLNPKHLRLFELLMFIGGRLREPMFLRYDHGGREDTNYIDEARQEIVLQRHKTWRKVGQRRIPISPEIRSVLDRCKAFRSVGNSFVFPADRRSKKDPNKLGPITDPYDTFYQLLETAKIKAAAEPSGGKTEMEPTMKKKGRKKSKKGAPGHTRIHDLRRSLISFGINEKIVSLEEMAKTIGHADTKSTADYWQIVEADQKRTNMAATTKRLAEIINS